MKVSSKIKKLSRINPFSFDNKKPKKMIQNKSFNSRNKNIKMNNKIILDNYDSKFNKTITEFSKEEFLKPEIITQKNTIIESNLNNDIIKYLEKELHSMNSEKNINEIVKIFEFFQEELINQLGDKYDELKVNQIMKNNFEIIIKYMFNFVSNYSNKYKTCISFIKNKINNSIKFVKEKNSIINNNTNNMLILNENIKKYIFNQEENVVNLINNLSSTIKTFNNKYKLLIINIENNLDSFNNKLIEIKNKINLLNKNYTLNYNYNIKTKNFNCIDIYNEIEKIYLTNINLNKDIKTLDNNHKLFFEDVKEIFNNLKINHKIKLKKYQKLFDFPQNNKRGNSELKYIKLNLTKINNIRTRNINDNFSTCLNITNNSFNKNSLNINLNNSQNSSNYNNNSFKATNILQINEENNLEIYYISQLMLEFFDKLKILQKAIINKEPNIISQKKEFEKYKRDIIKYLKSLKNINKKNNFIIKYKIIKEIEFFIISNNKQEKNIYKNIINNIINLINDITKENNNKNEIEENNINKIEEKINNFFVKIKKEVNELKESNEKLNNELLNYNNIQKNIKSKKSLIFDSEKDLNLSFREKNNNIDEEDSEKNNITGSFKKLEDNEKLNINEEILNFQINLQNKIKNLEKEIETKNNNNLNFFMKLNTENNNQNIEYLNIVKLYKEEIEKNKTLEEKYLYEIININNNLIKYYQNNNNKDGNLNYDYSNYNLNLSLIKAEIKELRNKIKEKEEIIKELNHKIETQNLIQKDKLYKPLRFGIELLITEINLNDKIKEILKEILHICLYSNEEIVNIFLYKEKNMNIIGLFKL